MPDQLSTLYGDLRNGSYDCVDRVILNAYFTLGQSFIQNPGVPVWWPGFCLSFDILASGFLAMLLMRRSGFASKV